MKEVVAILRRSRVRETQRALAEAGFPGVTLTDVLGRGKEGGLAYTSTRSGAPEAFLGFLPKKMLQVVVEDPEVPRVLSVIAGKNRTGEVGDGRIFVCPLSHAVQIRTGNTGAAAVR